MARKLVVCCDGTWNKPRSDTNIYRLFAHLAGWAGAPIGIDAKVAGSQSCNGRNAECDFLLYYDEGVGTRPWDWATGGVLGLGLSANVRQAYLFLATHYRPGDEIYVFGFSRGAYTARSLCGFIEAAGGLLMAPTETDVREAYLRYYATSERLVARPPGLSVTGALDRLRGWFGNQTRPDLDQAPRQREVRIRFVGVYDTVGALGIPLPKVAGLNEPIVGFHDTFLGPRIEHAVQALAVDERRGPFQPTLWRLPPGTASLGSGQTCLQVWFPGVHSDVGGGYPGTSIGAITFDFMLRRAAECGLFGAPRSSPLPHTALPDLPPQHESLDDFWRDASKLFDLPTDTRPIGPAARAARGDDRPAAGREMLHPSLVSRLGNSVTFITERPIGGDDIKSRPYTPTNLPWPALEIQAGHADLPLFRERKELRLPAGTPGMLDGRACTVVDRSQHGARVAMAATPAQGSTVDLDGRRGRIAWASGTEAGIDLAA